MDPLSATASIIAILSAIEKVLKASRLLYKIKDAGEDVEACCHEISRLRQVCRQLEQIHKQLQISAIRLEGLSQEMLRFCQSELNEAKASLTTFETFLKSEIVKDPATNKDITSSKEIIKHKWFQKRAQFEKFKTNLALVRMRLSDTTGLLTMMYSKGTVDHISHLASQFDALLALHVEERRRLVDAICSQRTLVEAIVEYPTSQLETGGTECVTNLATDIKIKSSILGRRKADSRNEINLASRRGFCTTACCTCRCHKSKTASNLVLLNSIFGRFCSQLLNFPFATLPCDLGPCRRQFNFLDMSVNYFFPSWLLSYMMSVTVAYSYRDGLSMRQLRVRRVIQVGAPIINMAQQGNIEGIKTLFSLGHASPFDVVTNGFSALHYGLNTPILGRNLIALYKLLIREGADPYEINAVRNDALSPFETLCELILGNLLPESEAFELRQMCEELEPVDDKYFAQWYGEILSPSATQASCADIDKFDSMGRTPLHWAALRNDYEAVCSLLRKGADPERPTKRFGGTAMHFAARSRNLDLRIIQVLLEHGADINSHGGNIQAPLKKAVACGHHATKILVDAGANVNIQDGGNKWTPLHLSIFLCQAECVSILLNAGGDLSVQTREGLNGVTIAQRYGNLDILCALQEHSANAIRAYEDSKCSSQLSDLQAHRKLRGIPPVSAEWWTLWNDIFQTSSRVILKTHSQTMSRRDTDLDEEEDEEFVDALE